MLIFLNAVFLSATVDRKDGLAMVSFFSLDEVDEGFQSKKYGSRRQPRKHGFGVGWHQSATAMKTYQGLPIIVNPDQ